MNSARKDQVFNELFSNCINLQKRKSSDYASDHDELANFKGKDAEMIGITPFQKWAIYFGKHVNSILSAIGKNPNRPKTDSEDIVERVKDAINYLALFVCLLEDVDKTESEEEDQPIEILNSNYESLMNFVVHLRDLTNEYIEMIAQNNNITVPNYIDDVTKQFEKTEKLIQDSILHLKIYEASQGKKKEPIEVGADVPITEDSGKMEDDIWKIGRYSDTKEWFLYKNTLDHVLDLATGQDIWIKPAHDSFRKIHVQIESIDTQNDPNIIRLDFSPSIRPDGKLEVLRFEGGYYVPDHSVFDLSDIFSDMFFNTVYIIKNDN